MKPNINHYLLVLFNILIQSLIILIFFLLFNHMGHLVTSRWWKDLDEMRTKDCHLMVMKDCRLREGVVLRPKENVGYVQIKFHTKIKDSNERIRWLDYFFTLG